MNSRQPSSRWALWVFAAALLLKSAMPWLASASAQLQGKALVEVCSVYGVSLMPATADGHAPVPVHSSGHGDAHCALTALTAFASIESPPLAVMSVASRSAARLPTHTSSEAPDACAAWVARLKHGPPLLT